VNAFQDEEGRTVRSVAAGRGSRLHGLTTWESSHEHLREGESATVGCNAVSRLATVGGAGTGRDRGRRAATIGKRNRHAASRTPAAAFLAGVRRVGLAAAVAVMMLAVWLLAHAVTAPGNDSFAARLAEAARNNGLGMVVTQLENLSYKLSPPKRGGRPDNAQLRQLAPPGGSPAADVQAVRLHQPLRPIDTPPLTGEGVFTSVVQAKRQPAVQVAYLRPDAEHSSYLAGVVLISRRLTILVQHPGAAEPGNLGLWSQPPYIPSSARSKLAATFNSGFKLADSQGGYYADHRTVGRLTTGSASLVVYSNGHADIGSWGSDVRMAPNVVSVRQNLKLLLDRGRLAPDLDNSVQSTWGATIAGTLYVWRSGAGVTATGDLVYAAGDALSARSLASLLQRAGAVRAMQLDINPSWVSFMWYSHGADNSVVPHKLNSFQRPADRYFTRNSRDFFAVYTR
jgi:hypothetical protein